MGRSSVVVEKNMAHFSEEKKKPLIRLFTRILVGKSNKWGCKRIVDNAHFSCTVSEYTFKKFQIHRFWENRKPTSHNNNAITACKIKGSHQFTTFIYQFTQNVFYVVCTIFSALIFVMRIFGSLSVDTTTTQFRADFDLSLLNYRFAHFQITRGIQINIFFMLVEYEVIFLLPLELKKKLFTSRNSQLYGITAKIIFWTFSKLNDRK